MKTLALPEERVIISLDANGNRIEEKLIDEDLLLANEKISLHLIHFALEIERWNRRQGTRKTKTISEVSGGGRKPYKQKGTGYARQGSIRAPQFRGGATVFGPRPQNFYKKINRKMRKIALKSLLNLKASQKVIYKIDDFQLEKPSTKIISQFFKKNGLLPKTITLIHNDDPVLVKSAMNIEEIQLVSGKRPTMPELYYTTYLVFTKSGWDAFVNVLKNK